jgi:hypothetical protein
MKIWDMQTVPYGWVKHFADGTAEVGSDEAISAGKASWTRGRQNGIVAVSLSDGPVVVYLTTDGDDPGKFWQSDDYEVTFGKTSPVLIKRRIQLKVGDKSWKTIEIDTQTHEITEYISKHKI